MTGSQLSMADARAAVMAARLLLSSGDGRRLMAELWGVADKDIWTLDERLKAWLDASHLDDMGMAGVN